MGKITNKLSGKTWIALLIFGLFGQLAWTIENMYFNVFLYNTISGDTKYIAAMVAASAITATVTTLLMGALSDKLGKRKAFIVVGYVLWGLSTLSFAFISVKTTSSLLPTAMAVQATALLVVIMDCVMTFFGSTANDAAFNAWVTDITCTKNRGRVESVLAIMPLIAMLVIFGGLDWLTAAGRWSEFFMIIGIVTMLGGILGFFFIKEVPPVTHINEKYFKTIIYGMRPSVIKSNKNLYLSFLGLAFSASSLQVFMPYLIIYLQNYLFIDNYALILGIVLIISSVITIAFGPIIDKIGKFNFLIPAAIVEIIGLVLMFFSRSSFAVIGAGIIMLGGSMLVSASIHGLIRDYTPEGKAGQFQGIRMFFNVLIPMVAGPFIGSAVIQGSGAVYENLGQIKQVPTPNIFIASAFVLLLIFIPLWLLSKSIQKTRLTPKLNTLLTTWGEALDTNAPLPEYPRPQLVRESYINLNGKWQYAFCKTGTATPAQYDGDILVPFSPETPLSGVNRQLKKDETLWYKRGFILPEGFHKGRILLNFGAVDQCCTVWCNGEKVGTHEGGYLPFTLDISSAIKANDNELIVAVTDNADDLQYSYGKQKYQRGGIWYTAQSGIWQTIWIESVPQIYIKAIKITPLYDDGCVEITVTPNKAIKGNVSVHILDEGKLVAEGSFFADKTYRIAMPKDFKSWSPEQPFLYDLTVTLGNDNITSYFGMRKFSLTKDQNGYTVMALNNQPYFHNGLLDQGYWSDGFYTPAHDNAMIYDIQTMKDLGFNMLRKHIKIEPLRWYYHCDRLGMLVWQDMVSGGDPYKPFIIQVLPFADIHIKDNHYKLFGRTSEQGKQQYLKDLEETVSLLYNTVSISLWVPFNEGWGQFDALKVTEILRNLDSTRLIDHASGWHDQGGGDLKSRHVYYKPVRLKADNRTLALTEFGGYSLPVESHMASQTEFGYRIYRTQKEFYEAYETLYKNEVIPYLTKGLSASVYTQVSDVEDELNGLLTYDRKVLKTDMAKLCSFNIQLQFKQAASEQVHQSKIEVSNTNLY